MKYIHAFLNALSVFYIELKSSFTAIGEQQTKQQQIDQIQILISDTSGYSFKELFANRESRKPEYLMPRNLHIIMLQLAVGLSCASATGVYLKNRTTYYNSLKMVKDMLQTDKHFRKKYELVFRYGLEINPRLNKFLNLSWL